MANTQSVTGARLVLGAMGALAGLCFYITLDFLPDAMPDSPRLVMGLATLSGIFFTAALALAGPLRTVQALAAAALLAALATALFTWASFRFDTPGGFIQTGHPLVALAILSLVPLPFFISRGVEGRWTAYPALFAHSWDIVVRYAAAWVFVSVVWGVVWLSDTLLGIVGLTIIRDLMEIDPVPYVMTGFTLGVALAVVNELSDYVSSFLVLRLLRLLLPAVLVVVLIFIAALPFRGLSGLFGGLSVAATLMAMAMGATTLVTTALDADDANAVQSPQMRAAGQIMALVLPVLGVLAGVAIWWRVAAHGWSPDRLAAATLAALVLAYGAAYCGAVLLRRDWMGRIRRINVAMALVVMAAAALWLTPAIDPQRIATRHQIARFETGQVSADTLDLWTIGHDWGRAGEAGIAHLAVLGEPRLDERLAAMGSATSRTGFEMGEQAETQGDQAESLRAALPVRPDGAVLPGGVLEAMRPWEFDMLAAACDLETPAGHPGCLALSVELAGAAPGPEVVVARLTVSGALEFMAYRREGGRYVPRTASFLEGTHVDSGGAQLLDRLFAGDYALNPVPAQTLDLGGRRLFFGP